MFEVVLKSKSASNLRKVGVRKLHLIIVPVSTNGFLKHSDSKLQRGILVKEKKNNGHSGAGGSGAQKRDFTNGNVLT